MGKQYGLILAATVMLASAAHAGEREGCRLCGMYIDQYQGTSAIVTSKDGRVEKDLRRRRYAAAGRGRGRGRGLCLGAGA